MQLVAPPTVVTNDGDRPRGAVAVVHDYLGQCGGAERVALELAGMFPDAPIFTSFYAPESTFAEFADRDVRTSSLQNRIDPERFRSAALRYPKAFHDIDLREFDTVVVSSSAFAHHVQHPRAFVYCHTPPRFLYDLASYDVSRVVGAGVAPLLAWLRRADRRAAARHLGYAANSLATARRVQRAYGRNVPVIHPPLWTAHLPPEPPPLPASPRALVVSRLLPYKRVDVAVRACALAGIPLTVVGSGPEEERLRQLAGDGARFVGRVSDADFPAIFADHSVVLVPGREDFGYVPVEANYAGRPVLALDAGGARETVVDGISGHLVTGDDAAWAAAVRNVHERDWDPMALREATRPYWRERFRAAVWRWIESPHRPVRPTGDDPSRKEALLAQE